MLKMRKSVALALGLGGVSLALSGVGAAQAAEKDPPKPCQWDGESLHCKKRTESSFTSEDGRKVVIQQTRDCSVAEDQSTSARGEQRTKRADAQSMDCANAVSR